VQNLALTMALIALSFNSQFSIIVYSYIFGLVISLECTAFVAAIRVPAIRRLACGIDPEEDSVEDMVPVPVPQQSTGPEKSMGDGDHDDTLEVASRA